MNANGREYVESDLRYEAVGCAMAVINASGRGLREKTYERALCVEFESRGFHSQNNTFTRSITGVNISLTTYPISKLNIASF